MLKRLKVEIEGVCDGYAVGMNGEIQRHGAGITHVARQTHAGNYQSSLGSSLDVITGSLYLRIRSFGW